MHSSFIAILVIIHACTSQAGRIEIIDYDRQCLMWSNNNYGCTGYSEPFAVLDGYDCSSRPHQLKFIIAVNSLPELSDVINGTRRESNVLNIDVCGTGNSSPFAWIQMNQTGLVTFYNVNGKRATCVLNNGLKAGSWCVPSEVDTTNSPSYSSTSTPSTSTPSTSTPSTSTPSTSTPSTSTPSTSTPSTSTPSTSTPSTSTPSTSTPSTSITKYSLLTITSTITIY
ncbi:unnamed protein product [Penicillium salamii]|uniref:Uncharacterized protein n=1 Tax=Penicillium salamii TaxID=1612424 RepID=A0A9W4IG23_9EURO|nr:unnamed protein product [Penicillium salamii]CAG8231184.1 unnamed protein product [Penicillium salamii]CAG8272238.1 unnamed protein product [Penicillium salamii]CAG8624737.1 unnamed protein product [Penicillium salamii]